MITEIIAIALAVSFLLILSAAAFIHTSDSENSLLKKLKNKIRLTTCICTGASALLTILDITNILSCGGYKLLPLYCTLLGIILTLFMHFSKKIPEKLKGTSRFSIRALAVCTLLELLVFNFNSAHLSFGDYSETILDYNNATVENFDINTGKNIAGGTSFLEFKGINMPVGTVSFDAVSSKKGYVNFSIDMTDETHTAYYRYGIASAQVIRDNKRSETVPCNFSGTVYDIKFSFNTDSDETVTLTSITLNKPITLHFSLIRFLFFFLGAVFIHLLASSEFFRRSYGDNIKGMNTVTNVFIILLAAVSFSIAYISRGENESIHSDFMALSGNQITQEIVDSFANGKVTMDIPMNEALEALENPYDGSQREAGQVGYYPWDHLYFEGEYYSYYGIAPVLTLFLPYYLLTGYYFPALWAVWLFGFFGMLFLAKFYLCFVGKFFRSTRSSLVLLGLILMELSCGIWFCFYSPLFYEIAQASGFICTTAGAYYLMRSNIIGEGKIRNGSLAISGIFLSLAVLSRPTLAVYCVAAMLFVYAGFMKKKALYTDKNGAKIKYYTPYFLCALLPYVIIGSIQMIYNYMRFGNPFDFGIQYSLTINDFTSTEYHTHLAAVGFFNYLFVIPNFRSTFPFITHGDVQLFNPQGYYFIATYSAIGLLWKSLPIISYCKTLKAYRISENKNKKLYTLLISAVCVICPFIIIASIWESGYGARYCVDFAWQIIIGALIISFIIYNKCSENMRDHLNKLMITSAVICFVLNFAQTYTWIDPLSNLPAGYQADALSLARIFEFWR